MFVDILQETIDGKQVDYRSGTMVSDTLAGKIKPTVVSPGEESWIAKLVREYGAANNGANPIKASNNPLVVRTPLVVAMWESRAKALGCWPTPGPDCTWEALRALAANPDGWGAYGHPEWRKFRFGYGYFGESNSGTLAVLAMCLSGLDKTGGLTVADVEPTNGCGQFISDIEKAKVHSGKSDTWLIDKMITGGPEYLDGVVTYESNVIATNLKSAADMREPLVSVYPQDGTIVVGHPYAILDGAPWVNAEQAQAAALLRDHLLSSDQQAKLADFGLRPADVAAKPGPPIDASHGANPDANITALSVPETLVIDRVGEVWHQVRKHAAIVIVFDKSGSMGGSKITSSIKGAQAFVNKMESADYLRWLPFDNEIYAGRGRPEVRHRGAAAERDRLHLRRRRHRPLRRGQAGLRGAHGPARDQRGFHALRHRGPVRWRRHQQRDQPLPARDGARPGRERSVRHPDPHHRHRRGCRPGRAPEDRRRLQRAVLGAQERPGRRHRLQGHRCPLLEGHRGPLPGRRGPGGPRETHCPAASRHRTRPT